jgi:glycosyltransferase involved in cell wall biosynthesis
VPLRVVQRSWTVFGRPRAEALVAGADVVHSLDLIPPPSALPVVATVHDVVALDYPLLHPRRALEQQRGRLRALRGVGVIMASSRATADALMQHGVEAHKIVVVPLGVRVAETPNAAPANRGRPFLLAVGEVVPRKGLDVLVRACTALDVDVIVAGPLGTAHAELAALIATTGLGNRVQLLGSVDDPTLSALYRDALALCFPSRAEGFGLPVLEAMAAGCPVVASDLPVLREIIGDDGVLVPVDDVSAWSRALHEIIVDDALRAELGRAGPRRAAGYPWATTAEATIHAYERAVGRIIRP